MLLGDLLTAHRMHELGLISRMVPAAGLEEEVSKIVSRLAANAPLSLRAMKAVLVRAMTFRDGIPHEDIDQLVRASGDSADAREELPPFSSAGRQLSKANREGDKTDVCSDDKAWQELTATNVAALGGELGVYQIADERERVLRIGFAGGRSLFGLRVNSPRRWKNIAAAALSSALK